MHNRWRGGRKSLWALIISANLGTKEGSKTTSYLRPTEEEFPPNKCLRFSCAGGRTRRSIDIVVLREQAKYDPDEGQKQIQI